VGSGSLFANFLLLPAFVRKRLTNNTLDEEARLEL